jgi:subtilase family serine protease
LLIEVLEERTLLSSSTPVGYDPMQIRTVYGINPLLINGIDGTGQTIAIVDEYDDPGLIDSNLPGFSGSDLALFDKQFDLPDPPSFMKVNVQGNTSPLPPISPTSHDNDWAGEETLDVAAYRSRRGMPNYAWYLDSNADGLIDSIDYFQFLNRYQTRLNPDGTVSALA